MMGSLHGCDVVLAERSNRERDRERGREGDRDMKTATRGRIILIGSILSVS